MAVASVTNIFAPLTLIESSEANTNFQDLVTFLNGQTMHRDASGAFTAVPSGPATDPISDNQLPRKSYVDGELGLVNRVGFSVSSSGSVQGPLGSLVSVVARGVTTTATGLTIVTTGSYDVAMAFSFSTNATGSRAAAVFINGVLMAAMGAVQTGDAVSGFGNTLSPDRVHVPLTAADVLTMMFFQNSGVALTANAYLWARRSR